MPRLHPQAQLRLPLLTLLTLISVASANLQDHRCGSAGFFLKAADVCHGPSSVVLTEAKPVVNFDDDLPSAAGCNLTIRVPAQLSLFGRLRYLAVRVFRPTPIELYELRQRRGLCLEAGYRLRAVSAQPPPGASAEELEPPPLRERRACLSPKGPETSWLFEEVPPPAEVANGTAVALLAEFSWRLTFKGIAAGGQVGKPLRLTFSVAPFYDCTGAQNPSRFMHCDGGRGLCVPKSLACCNPVVNYLECPRRAQFASSILDCAFYNFDVGFYLFLVIVGSTAVLLVLLCLIGQSVMTAVKASKTA